MTDLDQWREMLEPGGAAVIFTPAEDGKTNSQFVLRRDVAQEGPLTCETLTREQAHAYVLYQICDDEMVMESLAAMAVLQEPQD
jgi:hypothetical protein